MINEFPRGVTGNDCEEGEDGEGVLNAGGVTDIGIGGSGGVSFTGGGGGSACSVTRYWLGGRVILARYPSSSTG